MTYATAKDGTKLYYEETGSGLPVVFVHELLSKVILFGASSLRHCLENYVNHFHAERNHQGKGNVILFPAPRGSDR